MFLFSKKNKGTQYLLIHIDDHSSEIALVEKSTGKIILKALSSRRATDDHDDNVTLTETIRVFHKTLHNLTKKLKRNKTIHAESIEKALVFLGSPWYEAHLKNLTIKQEKKFTLTPELVSKVIRNEKDTIKNLNDGQKTHTSEIVDTHIAHISIHGYSSENPFNKETSEASLSVLFIESYSMLTKKIKEILEDHFSHVEISFKSTISSDLYSIHESAGINNQHTVLTFRLREKSCEVATLHQGILRSIESLPIGRSALADTLSKKIEKGIETADSLLSMYFDGSLTAEWEKKVDEAIKAFSSDFIENLQQAKNISSIEKENLEHATLVVNGDTHTRKILELIFKNSSFFVHNNKIIDQSMNPHSIHSNLESDLRFSQSILQRQLLQ